MGKKKQESNNLSRWCAHPSAPQAQQMYQTLNRTSASRSLTLAKSLSAFLHISSPLRATERLHASRKHNKHNCDFAWNDSVH